MHGLNSLLRRIRALDEELRTRSNPIQAQVLLPVLRNVSSALSTNPRDSDLFILTERLGNATAQPSGLSEEKATANRGPRVTRVTDLDPAEPLTGVLLQECQVLVNSLIKTMEARPGASNDERPPAASEPAS